MTTHTPKGSESAVCTRMAVEDRQPSMNRGSHQGLINSSHVTDVSATVGGTNDEISSIRGDQGTLSNVPFTEMWLKNTLKGIPIGVHIKAQGSKADKGTHAIYT